jgi:hypothetical protein
MKEMFVFKPKAAFKIMNKRRKTRLSQYASKQFSNLGEW